MGRADPFRQFLADRRGRACNGLAGGIVDLLLHRRIGQAIGQFADGHRDQGLVLRPAAPFGVLPVALEVVGDLQNEFKPGFDLADGHDTSPCGGCRQVFGIPANAAGAGMRPSACRWRPVADNSYRHGAACLIAKAQRRHEHRGDGFMDEAMAFPCDDEVSCGRIRACARECKVRRT
ncbi:hypothetical protein [Pseudoxanthomonas jiangsuensis]|uniref:hypothetical protein n=1 Tax=Pseudoxanthomonas jiangsuensis TaxID=619688 RepID=UPI001390D5CB|nr:hypothetical protein [Pseudoxanthomonas jiangsuensis]